jgi:hypothetical protein
VFRKSGLVFLIHIGLLSIISLPDLVFGAIGLKKGIPNECIEHMKARNMQRPAEMP